MCNLHKEMMKMLNEKRRPGHLYSSYIGKSLQRSTCSDVVGSRAGWCGTVLEHEAGHTDNHFIYAKSGVPAAEPAVVVHDSPLIALSVQPAAHQHSTVVGVACEGGRPVLQPVRVVHAQRVSSTVRPLALLLLVRPRTPDAAHTHTPHTASLLHVSLPFARS